MCVFVVAVAFSGLVREVVCWVVVLHVRSPSLTPLLLSGCWF